MMNESEMKKLAERLDGPIIHSGRRHGFIYLTTADNRWLVKPINHLQRALWWEQVDALIRERGFTSMPYFFIWQDKWFVMQYIAGRTIRYHHLWDLQQAVQLLAQFHVVSRWLPPPYGAKGSPLPDRLHHRYDQYKRLHHRLVSVPELSPFTEAYGRLGEVALNRLGETALIPLTQRDIAQGAIVHRDLASHNLLVNTTGHPWLIDFETVAVDFQLGDLWQMASRALVEWHWDPRIYELIMHVYQRIRPLNVDERRTLQHLFLFPNDFYRESLGLLKNRKGFSRDKVIPYLQMMMGDYRRWLAFLRYIGLT